MRDARFDFRFMVELLNEPFGDMPCVNIDVGLYGDIHLRAGGLEVPRQSGKTVQRLSNGVRSGDRNIERSFLLGLRNNLIDAGAQLKIGAAQRLFRWQKFNCRTAARGVFLDLVGRGEFETIRPVPMQARRGSKHSRAQPVSPARRRQGGGRFQGA